MTRALSGEHAGTENGMLGGAADGSEVVRQEDKVSAVGDDLIRVCGHRFPFENSSFGMCERTAYALFPLLNTDATMPFAHLTPRVVWFFDDRINSLRAAIIYPP
ncbi:hypothetical protein BaRGS_00023283 [Batillaria attramentaria]|uniref:Uncharacterized protein n=1 Tax=Batillaria attramentaria TaxID=370345 RepID=A0ABD0KED2_9CAEN